MYAIQKSLFLSSITSYDHTLTSIRIILGAIHKRRPRRGWEGGFRNPDKIGHRAGESYSTTRTSEIKKNKSKKYIVFCGIKRY